MTVELDEMTGSDPKNLRSGCHAVEFIDPRQTPFVPMRCRGELPHLYKEGGSYFVTFRLWDAVTPVEQRHRWRGLQELVVQPSRLRQPESARDLAEATEPPLRLGSCILRRADAATIVQSSLLHFDGERYQLAAWCVIPNHVHVAYTALAGHTPEDIHHSWKSYTSHQINKLLGRSGRLWERESFDHLIRSIEHYEAFIEYVENNPVQARLCESPPQWPYSSAAHLA